jgi:hypothetical protein
MRWLFHARRPYRGVEELPGLPEEEAAAKAHAPFLERKHLFEGFELWDRTRFLTRYPRPAAVEPLSTSRVVEAGRRAISRSRNLP